MILIGLGANIPHPELGDPVNTLTEAVRKLAKSIQISRQSSWYRSAPVPISDQPWFVNGVISIETEMAATAVLNFLHGIEREFGRFRRQKWEARVLDLDLLTFHDQVSENQDQLAGAVLPHPYIQDRAFVLAPIMEIAPEWHHPVSGKCARDLLEMLPSEQAFDVIGAFDSRS